MSSENKLLMPVEHGAWGLLLVPMLCAAILAGEWNAPLWILCIAALALFLLRGSIEARRAQVRTQPFSWKILFAPAHLTLLLTAAAGGLVLLGVYRRMQLIPVALAGGLLFLVQHLLVRAHSAEKSEKRSLYAELVGVALLSLAAPAAWIAARGALDQAGTRVWLLSLFFFLGGVLYVKFRVRGVLSHRSFSSFRERFQFAWPVFVYHVLLAAFLFAMVLQASLSAAVLAAFAPGILRACGLIFQLGQRFPIRRLGWTEVVHSVIFAVLLILAFRLQ
ncbi:MAG TPA: YwiC-like family protein [Candidatus Nitrosotenuis sp.]|nr:YwiC-like family protein [Candidatus Nitrosotenuis sp.]